MLARRNEDLLPQKTEPIQFAEKAKDLGALRDAVVDAASVGAGLWLSYLFALFYFAIAAGAVTHRDLLLESPVKLPFLNVELPLKAFFILGPLVFLIVHTYVLLHFVLLAGKIGVFNRELQGQISGPAFTPEGSFEVARARLRRQLPSNIFVQSLAGPREVRTGVIGVRCLLDELGELRLDPGWRRSGFTPSADRDHVRRGSGMGFRHSDIRREFLVLGRLANRRKFVTLPHRVLEADRKARFCVHKSKT